MPKSATYEADIVNLLLNATPIANIADNTATSPLTNLFVALHTASPTASGSQTTNEISYTGYSRVAISRSAGSPAWTLTGSNPVSASPNANITFGAMTAGTGGTVTFISVGSEESGAGVIYYFGTISPTINVVVGVQPVVTTATALTET
jgi:hypothetical protein